MLLRQLHLQIYVTKKSAPNQVKWTEECELAFQDLKLALCSAPVLRAPGMFILQTDASERDVWAVWSQHDDDDDGYYPVAYFSRKLLPREEKYSTVKKECLGVKLGVQSFRMGRKFVIETEHRALEWLDQVKDNNPRLTHWNLVLQLYKFTVKHRPG